MQSQISGIRVARPDVTVGATGLGLRWSRWRSVQRVWGRGDHCGGRCYRGWGRAGHGGGRYYWGCLWLCHGAGSPGPAPHRDMLWHACTCSYLILFQLLLSMGPASKNLSRICSWIVEILAVHTSYACACMTCTCQNDLLFAMDHLLWVTYEVIQSLRPLAPYLLVVLNVWQKDRQMVIEFLYNLKKQSGDTELTGIPQESIFEI